MKWTSKGPKPRGFIREHSSMEVLRRLPVDMWNYTPRGGRAMVETATDIEWTQTAPIQRGWEFRRWDDAVAFFADMALPQWPGHHWHVVDSRRTVILGYSHTDYDRAQRGPYGYWYGVSAAFRLLENIYDPMEVAIWETAARGQGGSDHDRPPVEC